MCPTRMEKIGSSLRVALEYNAAFNRHDVPDMMDLVDADCLFENTHPAPDGAVYSGKEAVASFWQDFFRESPHAHMHIEDAYGFGNHCIMRWRYEWMDATGAQGHVRGVDILKVRDHLIHEIRSYVKGWPNRYGSASVHKR